MQVIGETIIKIDRDGRIHLLTSLKHDLWPKLIINRLDNKLILITMPRDPIGDLEYV